MKKVIFGVLIVLLLFSSAYADGENLLDNGGFESISESGIPEDWFTISYENADANTLFEITDEAAHSGVYSAKIINANLNDARYVTTVKVEPDSMYRVSGYILVENMGDTGNGANFALEGMYALSESVFDTGGDWKYIEWYGETDTDQTEIELGVRVGGYSAESKGIAYFDDIAVEKVNTLPDTVYADLWYNIHTSASASNTAAQNTAPEKSTALFLLLGVFFALLTALGARYLISDDIEKPEMGKHTTFLFAMGMMVAFVLRLWLGGTIVGYSVDINCFGAWSTQIASVGPIGFYTDDYFCDYPPGYMLMLWPIGKAINALGYSLTPGILLLIKLIPIVCDMIIAILLFAYAKKHLSVKAAMFAGLLYALNPAVLVTGSAWGQVDSVLALFLLITAITAARKYWRAALPVFVLSILIKPQALLLAPVGLVWLIVSILFADKESRKKQVALLWQGLIVSIAAAAVVILPFHIRQTDPLWLVKRYQETLSSYNYAVLNTANLMYLLGGNWSALTDASGQSVKTLNVMIPMGTGSLLMAFGIWELIHKRGIKNRWKALWQGIRNGEIAIEESRKFMLAALCLGFGIAFLISAFISRTFLVYGTLWMVMVYLSVLLLILMDHRAEMLPFYMVLLLIGVYVLGLKIHERYLFAACALLPLSYVRTKDRRLLWLTVGFSVTTFINIAIVLDNSIVFGASMGHLNADTMVINVLLCIVNILLCGYAAWIAYTGIQESVPLRKLSFRIPNNMESHKQRLLHQSDARLHLTVRDFLIMGITLLVYSAVAFTNLGSTKAPQTAWVASSAEDQVVFELEENTTFKLLYYAGVSYHNFSVSVSDDGENWSDSVICRMREGLCYRWLYATRALVQDINTESFAVDSEENVVWLTGKYLRINAEFAGLNLWEIMLRDENGDQIPVSYISYETQKGLPQTHTSPENLIDEQDTLQGEPGWFNGTYFDEIYYARTAYEHLHGQAPYETSHPPLGKLIISLGVWLFGMTPFGWRFMGTLFGALMLPALYLFGKQLTKNRWFATFAMLLLALDLMHFTQTRITTIDTFPVFFILLSYLCMTRYVLADPFAVKASEDSKPHLFTAFFIKSMIPLFLSGLFIGFAIASKWTGLYAMVGLALLFVYAIYRQFRSGLLAHELDTSRLTEEEALRVKWARSLLLRRIYLTAGFCVLFFLVIPAVIYCLSYIPYLSPTGAVTLKRIIRTQQSMYAYHSTPGLGMDHPFYSPWWQWPLILKPMWYAKDAYVPMGYGANIICMGNPAVFYIGAIAMIAVLVMLVQKYLHTENGLRAKDDQPAFAILAISFLTQYLPWVLVPRSMFIYHYFPSLPFIILATMLMAKQIQSEKLRKILMIGLLAAALGLFVMFYPYASGMPISRTYMAFLRWFPNLPV